jgi:uncharacterized protein YjdB
MNNKILNKYSLQIIYMAILISLIFMAKIDQAFASQLTSDGGEIKVIFLSNSNTNDKDLLVTKLDAFGNEEWKKVFMDPKGSFTYKAIVKETIEGGFIILSTTTSGYFNYYNTGYDYYLLKLNRNGEKEWEKTFTGTYHDRGETIIQAKDGGYIIAGTKNWGDSGSGAPYILALKTNSTGQVEWEKLIQNTNPSTSWTKPSDIRETKTGYLIGGAIYVRSTSSTMESSEYRPYLIKLDTEGILAWEKILSFKGEFNLINETSLGHFTIEGFFYDSYNRKTNFSKVYNEDGLEVTSVTGISLDRDSINMTVNGNLAGLSSIVMPTNATNKKIIWHSDDEKIASVNNFGVVTPLNVGTTTITATTQDGNYSAICTVTVSDKVIGVLEKPTGGEMLRGEYPIQGWFLDGTGVSKIEILIDGNLIGESMYGLKRNDVAAVYPQYQNNNSGYSFNLNTSQLTEGEHILTIRETGRNGEQKELPPRKFFVSHLLPSIGHIDKPTEGEIVKGLYPISGWFQDVSGVSKIEVLIDGKVHGEASYGLPRSDVNLVYPNYQNPNSGFKYNLDTSKLSEGYHILSIRETGLNGVYQTLSSRKISISHELPSIGYLDKPRDSELIKGLYPISGWFLDGSGVSKIEVLIDGKVNGVASYGLPRSDVDIVYPKYNNANSGFLYNLDTSILTEGDHLLTIRETSVNGEYKILSSRKIKISHTLPLIGFIDTPKELEILKNNYVIKGWFLDGTGISKIEILIDGKVLGEATYGYSRRDVGKIYPQYENDYSGYNFTLETSVLTEGEHTLIVRATGMDGEQKLLPPKKIIILKSL